MLLNCFRIVPVSCSSVSVACLGVEGGERDFQTVVVPRLTTWCRQKTYYITAVAGFQTPFLTQKTHLGNNRLSGLTWVMLLVIMTLLSLHLYW